MLCAVAGAAVVSQASINKLIHNIMQTEEIKISVFNGNTIENAVYVLSRGKNTGKVLSQPCPNCYAISIPQASTSEVKAVANILFVSGKLKPFLHGSVIEFVTVENYRKLFLQLWRILSPEKVEQTAKQLSALDLYQLKIQQQLKTISQLRTAIAFAALE
jgi:hypothetical protein